MKTAMTTTRTTFVERDLTRYLILGLARTGTTVLHLSVMGHPNVSALSDEIPVQPFFGRGLSTFTFGNEFEQEKERGHLVLFDAITSITATAQTTAIGAKTVAHTCEQAHIIVDALQKHLPGIKVVLTLRNDMVAQYGSLRGARATGAWHSWYRNIEDNRQQKMRINRSLFTRAALHWLDSLRVLRRLHDSHDVHEWRYENFMADREASVRGVFRFLGLPNAEIAPLKSEKVKPPPQQYIHNYTRMAAFAEILAQRHKQNTVPVRARIISAFIERASRCCHGAKRIGASLITGQS